MTGFEMSTLPTGIDLETDLDAVLDEEDPQFPDVFVGFAVSLVAPGDGVVMENVSMHATRVLDAQLRRISSVSTALQYIEDFQKWRGWGSDAPQGGDWQ